MYRGVNMNIRSRLLKVKAEYLFEEGIHMGTRAKYLA